MTDTPKQWRMVPVEHIELALSLIDDMSRFVGQMALRDYAAFNDAPIYLRRALAASPAPDLEGLRERVARVIDPMLDGVDLGMPHTPGSRVGRSLATSDAVLALIFTPEGEGRE